MSETEAQVAGRLILTALVVAVCYYLGVRFGLAFIASDSSESDDVREAQRLGAGPYLRKPYTLDQLGAVVKAELAR